MTSPRQPILLKRGVDVHALRVGDHVCIVDIHVLGQVSGIAYDFGMVMVQFANGAEKWVSASLLAKLDRPVFDPRTN